MAFFVLSATRTWPFFLTDCLQMYLIMRTMTPQTRQYFIKTSSTSVIDFFCYVNILFFWPLILTNLHWCSECLTRWTDNRLIMIVSWLLHMNWRMAIQNRDNRGLVCVILFQSYSRFRSQLIFSQSKQFVRLAGKAFLGTWYFTNQR